jgi:hypothetical protein
MLSTATPRSHFTASRGSGRRRPRVRPVGAEEDKAPWGRGFVSEAERRRKELLEKQAQYAMQVKATNRKAALEAAAAEGGEQGLPPQHQQRPRAPTGRGSTPRQAATTIPEEDEQQLMRSIARLDKRLARLSSDKSPVSARSVLPVPRSRQSTGMGMGTMLPLQPQHQPNVKVPGDLPRRPRAPQGYTNA